MSNGADDRGVRETKMEDLINRSRTEIERLQDISQRIYGLYISLFGAEPEDKEDPGPTTGQNSIMSLLITMSDQKAELINDIGNKLSDLENELRA